jgi:uncharacterized protein YndB with AHSA1/START domain
VNTETFDRPDGDGSAVATIVFEERRGKTTVTETLRYQSKQARDVALAYGMATGLGMSFHRLDVLLEPMAASARRHAHAH